MIKPQHSNQGSVRTTRALIFGILFGNISDKSSVASGGYLFDNNSVNSILEEHRQTLALNILWKSVSVNVFQVKTAKNVDNYSNCYPGANRDVKYPLP